MTAASPIAARRCAASRRTQARVIGISPVFQEFSLVPELTVEENLFLGREITRGGVPRPARDATQGARSSSRELGFDLDPRRKVARPVARPPADGRDRQGAARQRAAADPRRADRLAHRGARRSSCSSSIAKLKARASASSTSRTACARSSSSPTASPCCATAARSRRCNAGERQRERAGRADDRPQDRRAVSAHRAPAGRELLEVEDLTLADQHRQRRRVPRARRRDHRHRRARRLRQVRAGPRRLRPRADRRRRHPDRAARPYDRSRAARRCCSAGCAISRPTASPRAWRSARPIRENASMAALDLPDFAAAQVSCGAAASGARSRASSSGCKLRPPQIERGGRQPVRRQPAEGDAGARPDPRHRASSSSTSRRSASTSARRSRSTSS